MIARGLGLSGVLLTLSLGLPSSVPLSGQDATPWLFESGITWKVSGDRYPDDATLITVAAGGLWHYAPAASLGAVLRTGFTLEKKSSNCSGGYPCVLEDSMLPIAIEARYRRAFQGVVVSVGAGPLFDVGAPGLATHVALHFDSVALLSVHGDLYKSDWHWLLTAGLDGKAGLIGFGALLVLRTFAGFADG